MAFIPKNQQLFAFSVAIICLCYSVQAQDILNVTVDATYPKPSPDYYNTSTSSTEAYPLPDYYNRPDQVATQSYRYAYVVNNLDYSDPTNASTFLYYNKYQQQTGEVDGNYNYSSNNYSSNNYSNNYSNDTQDDPFLYAALENFTNHTADGTYKLVNSTNFTINGTNFAAGGIFYFANGVNFTSGGSNYSANGTNFTASGNSYFAQGDHFQASGYDYFASGSDFIVDGTGYFATGERFQASGQNYQVYGDNYIASGDNYTAMGSNFNATGTNVTAFGSNYTLNGLFFNHTDPTSLSNYTSNSSDYNFPVSSSDSQNITRNDSYYEDQNFFCYFRDLSNYSQFIAAVDYLQEYNLTNGYREGQYVYDYSQSIVPFPEFGDNYTFQWSLESFYQDGDNQQNPCWLQKQLSGQSRKVWDLLQQSQTYQSRYQNFYPVNKDTSYQNATATDGYSNSSNDSYVTMEASASSDSYYTSTVSPTIPTIEYSNETNSSNSSNSSYMDYYLDQKKKSEEEFRRLVPVGQGQSRVLNISKSLLKQGSSYSFVVDVRRKNESALLAAYNQNSSSMPQYHKDPYVFSGYTYFQFQTIKKINDFLVLFPNREDAASSVTINPQILDISSVANPAFTVTYDFTAAQNSPIVIASSTVPQIIFRLRREWDDFDSDIYTSPSYIKTDRSINWPSGSFQVEFTEKEIGAVAVRFEFLVAIGSDRYAFTTGAGILGLDYSQVQAITNKFADGASLGSITLEDVQLGLASLANEFGSVLSGNTAAASSSTQDSSSQQSSQQASSNDDPCKSTSNAAQCSGKGQCVDGKNGLKKCKCDSGFDGKFCESDATVLKASQDKLKNMIGAFDKSSLSNDDTRQSMIVQLKSISKSSLVNLDIGLQLGDTLASIGKQAKSVTEISGLLESVSDIALAVSSSDNSTAENSKKVIGYLTGLTGKTGSLLLAGESQEDSKPTFVAKTVKLGGASASSSNKLNVAASKGIIQNGVELPAPSVEVAAGSLPANADSVSLLSVSPSLAGSLVTNNTKGVLTQFQVLDANGDPIAINGLAPGLEIKVVVSLSSTETISLECVYLDEVTNEWRKDGTTLEQANTVGQASCKTSHLTMFTVQTATSGNTTDNTTQQGVYGQLLTMAFAIIIAVIAL